ncbi:MAG TPA: 16S rRNA (guanine(527)-N(7))-methyltransferase RsmG [Jatrophihabitans sp.]|uniref:16S rRNA (guanine(527)-N(7))-methyltransferase RsmG n=1 Tax=Jatrophihabitans sp. TaxID=1932789 RepID=UPI002EF9FFAC
MTGSGPAAAPSAPDGPPAQPGPAAPAPPEIVLRRFGPAAELLTRYAEWLAGPGTSRGLLGPREVPRLWDRHLLNSVALAELIPQHARLVDIGTGAGLPGLAVACVRPDLTVDLVESLLRRTDFLTEVVAALGLADRVRVIRGRAEDSAVRNTVGSAQFVTARAVAPLDRLVRWSFPLLRPGGSLLALKGASAEDEVSEHQQFLTRMRAEVRGVIECGAELVDPPTRVVHLVRK